MPSIWTMILDMTIVVVLCVFFTWLAIRLTRFTLEYENKRNSRNAVKKYPEEQSNQGKGSSCDNTVVDSSTNSFQKQKNNSSIQDSSHRTVL